MRRPSHSASKFAVISLIAIPMIFFTAIHLPGVPQHRHRRHANISNVFEVSCYGGHSIVTCSNNARNYDDLYNIEAQFATEDDFINEPLLRRVHDTCAVVGSSGNLLNYEFGAEIDAHEIVFRINLPHMKGYEKYVGSRVGDVLVLNYLISHWPCHNPKHFILTCHRHPAAYSDFVRNCWTRYGRKTYGMAPRVMELSKEIFHAYGRRYGTPRSRFWIVSRLMVPTSGLDAVVFALHLCREVHMYGFGLKGAKKFEYFANATNEEVRNSHDFPAEAYFFTYYAEGRHDNSLVDLSWKGYGKLIIHGPTLI